MKIVFFTGAGISAPSGLPTYRGKGGLWTENPELEDKINADTLKTDPKFIWDHVDALCGKLKDAKPNAAHETIWNVAAAGHEVTVITQNVDNLHEDPDGRVVCYDLHGNAYKKQCLDCGGYNIWKGFEDGEDPTYES